jgi:hypothetical protein
MASLLVGGRAEIIGSRAGGVRQILALQEEER